jgi:asparagine synthase (glutamine-hydrolysing)
VSGIAGLLRFDGAPVGRRDLERVANALQPHGSDRSEISVADGIGLVHVLMRITPEDRFDRQPWRGASGATITADLRLDNRADVLALLGVPPADAAVWPDSRVVLTAWERFGDDLWPKLHGPFAAAIWDPRRRRLTLARDHLGLAVVMWHRSERFFAFATMPKALFALPDVPRRLNEEKFADFLVLNHADHATTMYRDIFRLPPAHVATVEMGGSLTLRRYWSPADIEPVRLASDEAYADGLRERLDVAVRRQMRSAHPIACHLTGGLDSSSVAALAARALAAENRRLAAFTQVPRQGFDGQVPLGRYADETPYVEMIRQAVGNIDVTYVRSGECDDFAELDRLFLALEAPVRNVSNLGWMATISRLARGQGCRVLLSGQLGNHTISWSGWSQTVDHLLRGHLLTAFRQARLYCRESSDSRPTALHKLLIEPLLPQALGNWFDRLRNPGRAAPWQEHSAIRPAFASAMGVEKRAAAAGHDFLYRRRRGERFAALQRVDYLGDWLAAEKAMYGVETRDPTADLGLVSYCFGIPPEQYLAEGTDRSLIRRAMWGLLPEAVLTNRLTGPQAADWHEKLTLRRDTLAAAVQELAASPLARRAIDLERVSRSIENWPAGDWHTRAVIYQYELALTRAIAGGRYLRWIESANR